MATTIKRDNPSKVIIVPRPGEVAKTPENTTSQEEGTPVDSAEGEKPATVETAGPKKK